MAEGLSQEQSILEEIGRTFDEMYADCNEEMMSLDQERRDVELFLTKTFPEAVTALEAFKQNSSPENFQALESAIDLLYTQYARISHLGLTAEHLVSSLAKLMDRLDSFLQKFKRGGQDSSFSKVRNSPNLVLG